MGVANSGSVGKGKEFKMSLFEKFVSGNSVPVTKASITWDELYEFMQEIKMSSIPYDDYLHYVRAKRQHEK